MMAHNLCYTTLVDLDTVKRLELVKDVDYVQTPNNGDTFRVTKLASLLKNNIRSVCYEREAERLVTHYPRGSLVSAKASQGGPQKGNGPIQAGCVGWPSTRSQSKCEIPFALFRAAFVP